MATLNFDPLARMYDGHPENRDRCVVSVFETWHSHQCNRRRGKGPDGLYCTIHARRLAEGRRDRVPEVAGYGRAKLAKIQRDLLGLRQEVERATHALRVAEERIAAIEAALGVRAEGAANG